MCATINGGNTCNEPILIAHSKTIKHRPFKMINWFENSSYICSPVYYKAGGCELLIHGAGERKTNFFHLYENKPFSAVFYLTYHTAINSLAGSL